MTIGERVIQLREETGLSQRALAEKISLGNSTISRLEKNEVTPDMDTIQKLANFFDVSIDYLMNKTPFRNTQEERHSIIIAALVQLIWDNGVDREDWVLNVINERLKDMKHLYTENSLYCINHIVDKIFDSHSIVKDIEYYDIALFITDGFRWPKDYKGPVVISIKNEKIPVFIDYWDIPRIIIDESQSIISYSENDTQAFSEIEIPKPYKSKQNEQPLKATEDIQVYKSDLPPEH